MTNLEKWNYFLRDIESPQLYIDWTFYYMIGAALERRVWFGDSPFELFPNIYVVFIGPSRIGKTTPAHAMNQIIFKALDYTDATGKIVESIKRGPDSVSLEKLINYMHDHFKTVEIPQEDAPSKLYTYSPLAFVAASELGTLFKNNTEDLVRFLTQGWECHDFNKKILSRDDSVKNMCISLLGCATGEWLRTSIKSSLFDEGFSARLLWIYADRKRKLKFDYAVNDDQLKVMDELREYVKKLTQVYGKMHVPEGTMEWLREWYERRNRPINPDRNLKLYYECKKLHLIKQAMIVHFARTWEDMTLTIDDCEEALEILNRAEVEMGKALSGVGANPLAELSAKIEQYFVERKEASKKELTVQFWSACPSKTTLDIDSTIEYLVSSGIIFEHKLKPEHYIYAEKAQHEKIIRLNSDLAAQLEETRRIRVMEQISKAPVESVKISNTSNELTTLDLE